MFIHLHCHSPYSFLAGASSIESLVAQAALYRMLTLALTDHNTIAACRNFIGGRPSMESNRFPELS
ncbi:hypothetical protein GCM10025858_31050 [Alicyclobacillus sacchari]|nr:hypothetical protein GCM10025858_31050 [Alicyclobacillus sacchari]